MFASNSLGIPTLNFAEPELRGAQSSSSGAAAGARNRFLRCAPRTRPSLYLPGRARRGRLLLRGNWCRARLDDPRSDQHLESHLCPGLIIPVVHNCDFCSDVHTVTVSQSSDFAANWNTPTT